jgi:hypothetical protein
VFVAPFAVCVVKIKTKRSIVQGKSKKKFKLEMPGIPTQHPNNNQTFSTSKTPKPFGL